MTDKARITTSDTIAWLVVAGFVVGYLLTRMIYRDETDNYISSIFSAYPVLLPTFFLVLFSFFAVDDFKKAKKGEKRVYRQLISILCVLFFSVLLMKGITNAF